MNISLPYGRKKIEIEVPDDRLGTVIRPREKDKYTVETLLSTSFSKSHSSGSIKDFIQGDTVYLLNDGTRPTPTSDVLNYLDNHFELSSSSPQFLIATGSHRSPTGKELRQILGSRFGGQSERVHAHDARESDCVFLGETSRGTPVEINRRVVEAEKAVIITSVEPHYFAGFTGGRKSILPGVSSYDTIEANHHLYFEPGSDVLNLSSNPVHLDMVEALDLLDTELFAINIVLDRDHDPYSIHTGDVVEGLNRAGADAREIFVGKIDSKAPIVVTAASFPMDIDLYQSQKALANGQYALSSGGIIILVSQCRAGVGNEEFLELLSSRDDPEEVLEKIKEEYHLGYHKAASIAELAGKAEIWGFTDLPARDLDRAGIKPLSDLGAVLQEAMELRSGPVHIIPDGSMTVPQLSSSASA